MTKKKDTSAIEPGRRYRGSAILAETGDFLFTPYGHDSNRGARWRTIKANSHAILRETNEVLQIRATISKSETNNPQKELRRICFEILI